MGIPSSRFMLFHRMVLFPPLILLTLTCLYTSSTLSPFSETHRLSFSQDVQCFSCESSSFPSRSFLSLANFPASSYIRDVVLRHNALRVEDSRGETTTEPVSRRDTNEVESVGLKGMENVPEDEANSRPETTTRAKDEVGLPAADEQIAAGIIVRQQKLFDDIRRQQEKREEEVHAIEELTNDSPSDGKIAEDSKVGNSVSRHNAAPAEQKLENSTPSEISEKEVDSSVTTVSNDGNIPVLEGENVDRSVQILEFSTETKDNSGDKKEAVPSSVSEDKNGDSAVQIVEFSTEMKQNFEGGNKGGVPSSLREDKNVESSVGVVELVSESKENSEGGRKGDVPSSVPEDSNVDSSVQVEESSTKPKGKSGGSGKEDKGSSVPEDKNDDSSVLVAETKENSGGGGKEDMGSSIPDGKNDDRFAVVAETKENSGGGGKEDMGSSIPEDKNDDSSVVVAETKENFGGGRKEDLQLENRHLTSEDHAGPNEHLGGPMEGNVSVTEVAPVAEAGPREVKNEETMMFGHVNMTEEHKFAGIAVQKLMNSITRSGLPVENRNSPPDADVDVNLWLRGNVPQGIGLPEGRSCEGRHVFVYNLPSKFNADLVGQCDTLLRWFNFCDYFMNEGMGTNVPTNELNDRGEKVLVPDGSWFLTHQYALELIFHARLKHYPCITTDVNQADLFFVPYYAGLDVIRWHFQPNVSNDRRDELTFELMSWLESQETWSRNKGIDHVFVLGKIGWDFRRADNTGLWGSKLLMLPSMGVPTKVLIERDPWHPNDVGVPHPTFFHPKDDNEIRTWLDHVDQSERRYLVSFAGMPRPNMLGNVRGHLIQQCLDHPDDCFLLRCVETLCLRPDSTMNLFLHSHFCMQPPGDSPTRRSVFDSLVGGCIPVLFDPYTAYYQYPWHLPQNTSSYSVFIPSHDVMSGKSIIVEILKSISPEERTAMRRRIIREIIPGLLYSQPGTKHSDFRDAFDISIEALLHRVANLRAEKQQST